MLSYGGQEWRADTAQLEQQQDKVSADLLEEQLCCHGLGPLPSPSLAPALSFSFLYLSLDPSFYLSLCEK
jgi:hypothetical protein